LTRVHRTFTFAGPHAPDALVTTWRCAAVLFDLDGVLVDSRRCIEAIWRAWAAGKGLDPGPPGSPRSGLAAMSESSGVALELSHA
jgi:hypothetical protein